jgi:hypothetical protein
VDGQAPCCRAYHTAVLVGSQVFIFGGWKVRLPRLHCSSAVPAGGLILTGAGGCGRGCDNCRVISSSTTFICWTALTACVQVR